MLGLVPLNVPLKTCMGTLVSTMSAMPSPPNSLSPHASKMPSSPTAKELRRVASVELISRSFPSGKISRSGPWVSRREVWVYICYRACCSSLVLFGRTDELLPSSLSLSLFLSLSRSRTHTLSLSHTHTAAAARRRSGRPRADLRWCASVCVTAAATEARRTTGVEQRGPSRTPRPCASGSGGRCCARAV